MSLRRVAVRSDANNCGLIPERAGAGRSSWNRE